MAFGAIRAKSAWDSARPPPFMETGPWRLPRAGFIFGGASPRWTARGPQLCKARHLGTTGFKPASPACDVLAQEKKTLEMADSMCSHSINGMHIPSPFHHRDQAGEHESLGRSPDHLGQPRRPISICTETTQGRAAARSWRPVLPCPARAAPCKKATYRQRLVMNTDPPSPSHIAEREPR